MAGAARDTRAPGRWRLVQARRQALSALLRRLVARSRRNRRRTALTLSVAGAAVAVVVAGYVVVYHTQTFAVRDVTVRGAHVVPARTVARTAAVPSGVPLPGVDLAAVGARVRRLAPVAKVEVTRDWPHTVVVTVTERTPAAAVPDGSSVRLVDGSGVVFRTVPAAPGRLPTLVVSHPGPHDVPTLAGLQVLRQLTPRLRAQLVRVEVPRPTRIRLVLAHGRTVVWGDSSSGARKAAAATALLGKDGTVIDVSAPDLVVVR
ncbi:FtsQ-type POTRA domain-containing protein [Actinocatenispora sera]|uniref:Cell division protein FtsQ n=1 Tax=Actinocatenispora sera TaxID=390989 RepID=A0A810L5S9_9ACTN|nr:FtsQ-type POTRA domain-containing protein [Actinocatenispora sera]BCJ30910.1 hypothetical protein Asera_50180 [Actinocatenispora sera]